MKTTLIAAAMLLGMAGAGAAHDIGSGAQPHGHILNRAHSHSGPTITQQVRINCYRGPWRETIWDHPRGEFIDDLMMLGYDYTNASAIAYRVCRDVTNVGNVAGQKAALLNAIAQTPPGQKPHYAD